MSADRLRALEWEPRIGPTESLRDTYEWYLANISGQ